MLYKNKKLTRLDEVMVERGVSTVELAKRLGKSSAYVNNIRHGHTTVSLALLYTLAEVIGCHPAELIVGYETLEKAPR